jgi:hypothetical protein
MPTVAEVVIVGKDLFTSAAVHVTPSGLRYALKLAPERTSFIHKFGYAYVAWAIEPLKLYWTLTSPDGAAAMRIYGEPVAVDAFHITPALALELVLVRDVTRAMIVPLPVVGW